MIERIMIVDDEINMARAIARALERSGYSCATFTNGAAALLAFEREGADLVLTDQRMPEMDGVSLMRRLHALNPRLPVILITAFGGVASAVQAMKEGAFDYVTKPFDYTELRALVSRALKLDRLERENRALRTQLHTNLQNAMVAESKAMRQVLDLVDRAAQAQSTVLIQGESGTGKEMIARRLHLKSPRVAGPFVAVNCKAFAESVLESELFGHEKGAFTGAHSARLGCFERAQHGTLFLDEIGETHGGFQAKLLRVLQEKEVLRVGGTSPRAVDVRVVAATNRNLQERVSQGHFREDLYFRLNVIPIHLPSLRERSADILPLARHFLERQAATTGRRLGLSTQTESEILRHSWPGNVRELENAVERAVVLAERDIIEPEDLLLEPAHATPSHGKSSPIQTLQEAMDDGARQCIQAALKAAGHRKAEAAALLGVERTTLYRFMKRLGLKGSA